MRRIVVCMAMLCAGVLLAPATASAQTGIAGVVLAVLMAAVAAILLRGAGMPGLPPVAETEVGDAEKTLEKVKSEYKGLMEKEVPAYNKQIEGSGIAPLATVDVRSEGFGRGDPAASATTRRRNAMRPECRA